MDEIHVHKTKKSICAHFAESPCKRNNVLLIITLKIKYCIFLCYDYLALFKSENNVLC